MTPWRERIERAKAHGCFSESDIYQSALWACCAVGEQAELNSLVVSLCLIDAVLEMYGMDFMTAVKQHDFHGAARLLDRIEDRVLELKRGHVS